ncbi:MAG: hypothetical protein PHF29_07980 [Candidatus Riflebacteria bacterium]|nr:hypothetical protein [Candidatus Riflebacteria bacterium]
MKYNKLFLLSAFVLLFSNCFAATDTGKLHEYYEQNGDCFVLIGEGPKRAVWALNNLVAKPAAQLYDPYESYGIVAAQNWNTVTNKTEKDLFTFSSQETALKSIVGTKQPRAIVVNASNGVWPFNVVPDATVHRFHSAPNAGPTGRGNHNNASWLFGIDYPCTVVPDAVATMPGYYWYPVGQGYYHARNMPVWSNWTYRAWNPSPAAGTVSMGDVRGGVYTGKSFPSDYIGMSPKGPLYGPWVWICCSSGASHGGWVRRMVREKLSEAYRNLDLYKYRVGSGASSATSQGRVASIVASRSGTMDLNGECCDGCIAAASNVAMPGVANPYVSCVYSAKLNKTYVYRRDVGQTDYTLSIKGGGADYDQRIGNPNDLTCTRIGISSKDAVSNYLYFLGKNEINKWMTQANVPASMKLNELTAVAVSDQWWQTGGIVYAYDATKGKVYSFVRKEGGEHSPPDEISVNDGGILPDAIGADGFGSLYMLKTEYSPSNTSTFVDGNETSRVNTGLTYAGSGKPLFKAVYKQNVYKSVYKRAYDTGKITKEKNSILLGTNTFERRYITADNKIDSIKSWVDGAVLQIAPVINASIRSELAVINSPTPPRPAFLNAATDCVGPMLLGASGFEMAAPGSDGLYENDKNLYFIVENAPYFDANDLNVGNTDGDVDRDGRTGRFPNTLEKAYTKYYWKIIRTHDREGNKVDETDSTNLILKSEGNYILVFPSELEGKFKVGVKVTYGYYDYSNLKVGELADAKKNYLVTGKVAKGEDSEEYSWQTIGQKLVPKILTANDKAILMTSTNSSSLSGYKPGAGLPGFGCGSSCGHTACSKSENPAETTYFIMDGYSLVKSVSKSGSGYTDVYQPSGINWGMRVRETKYNIKRGIDRIASMTGLLPPRPTDPQLVPGTEAWANNLSVSWTSELKRGSEVVFRETVLSDKPYLNLSELRKLMPVVSEPLRYSISVTMSRKYMYEYYNRIPKYVGGVFTGDYENLRVPKIVSLDLWADAEVCVTDNTPPDLFVFNAIYKDNTEKILPAYALKKNILYATTGEPLTAHNTGNIDFYVVDNNPMANYTGSTVLKKGDKDLYHYSAASPNNRLTVNFAAANKQAMLNYDSIVGDIPGADATLNAYYKASPVTVTDATEIANAGLVYSKVLSYQKYSYPVSKFAHCSKKLDDVTQWSPNMPMTYANNTPGYTNRLYGISWQEACNSSNNKLSIGAQKIGHIVTKDNDRPNVFITAVQDKYPNRNFYAPSGLALTQMPPYWVVTKLDTTSGPDKWYKNDGGSIADDFKFLKITAPINTQLFSAAEALETDVPVTFGAMMSDNAGAVATVTFRIEKENGDILYDASTGGSKLPMQYVFRTPGKYTVVLTANDDALNWPSVANALKNPKNATAAKNSRTVKAIFDVIPTKLEFRILERDNKGN